MNHPNLTDKEVLTMAKAYEDAALGSGAWNRLTTEEKFAALDGMRAALAHLPVRFTEVAARPGNLNKRSKRQTRLPDTMRQTTSRDSTASATTVIGDAGQQRKKRRRK